MYYFAYGSNMNLSQMRKRCPGARFICRAYLSGYRFVYDGYSSLRESPVANIVEDTDGMVWGGLFELDDLSSLDRYEGYPHAYQREEKLVKDDQNNEYRAWVYLRKPLKEGTPHEKYRKAVCDGARDCGLPAEYIKKYL